MKENVIFGTVITGMVAAIAWIIKTENKKSKEFKAFKDEVIGGRNLKEEIDDASLGNELISNSGFRAKARDVLLYLKNQMDYSLNHTTFMANFEELDKAIKDLTSVKSHGSGIARIEYHYDKMLEEKAERKDTKNFEQTKELISLAKENKEVKNEQ